MERYKPLLSKKEIVKLKKWQDETYNKLSKIRKKFEVEIFGKKIIVLPNVFAPLWFDSALLARVVKQEIKNGNFVLDMGTGTGIQSIFAAQKASNIIAVDINSEAIRCAKLNIEQYKLERKIKLFKSNLFSNIHNKFDVIVFNPPFRWFKPRDILEQGELDENYRTLLKFFAQVKKYLKSNGYIILIFSNSGDIKFLEKLIKSNKFKSKILAQEKKDSWNYFVYKLTSSKYKIFNSLL